MLNLFEENSSNRTIEKLGEYTEGYIILAVLAVCFILSGDTCENCNDWSIIVHGLNILVVEFNNAKG